ncbi:MAG TPA: hypothetical protein DIW44_07945 [Anaerolineaceae bacterium]|nr:hypothetical protein [Anaerolineaceae bacterium]
MILTGLLSLLQILFLPGLIFNAFIKKETGILYRLSFTIAFSMLFNLLLTLLLVTIHIYFQTSLLIIIIIETVVIILLYRRFIFHPFDDGNISVFSKTKETIMHFLEYDEKKQASQKILVIIRIISLLFAFITLGWVLFAFVSQIGSVFTKWDAVVSYNRWATEWANGLFPIWACEYPQLLPANWSLTYILTESSIGIFAKLVQGVFPILFVLAMLDFGLTVGSAGFLFGVPISILLLKNFAGASLFEGYMDVAVTTLILLSFYMIFKDLYQNTYTHRTLWLSGIVILAAAMTKQPGVLAFGSWVLINFFLFLYKNPRKVWFSIKKILIPSLVFLVIVTSWYVFKINRDALVGETSCFVTTNSWAINDLNSGFWKNLLFRIKLLDYWFFFIPILFISTFVAKREIKLLFLCFGIPYLMVSFGYGLIDAFVRYLTPITFVFAISGGVLLDPLLKYLSDLVGKFPVYRFKNIVVSGVKSFTNSIRKNQMLVFVVSLILLIISINFLGANYPDSKLIRNNEYQQMGVGNRIVNNYLVEFYKDKDPEYTTLTYYYLFTFVPGLEERAVINFGGSVEKFSKTLKREDIHYVLLYNTSPKEITDYAFDLERKGQFKFITDFGLINDAILFEIIR